MYPTLHIYLHRLSPLVCLQHHPCFSFCSIQILSSELPFSFSYFTHIFAHGSHFPLLPSLCMPSITHGVTNYLPIIFHTDIRSQSSLVYDRDFYIAIVLFVVHGGFFFFFFFECSSREKKIKSKAPPVVLECAGTIDCFGLRGVRTPTIPIMVQITANCTARKTNKSNCSRQCANRQTKFR